MKIVGGDADQQKRVIGNTDDREGFIYLPFWTVGATPEKYWLHMLYNAGLPAPIYGVVYSILIQYGERRLKISWRSK